MKQLTNEFNDKVYWKLTHYFGSNINSRIKLDLERKLDSELTLKLHSKLQLEFYYKLIDGFKRQFDENKDK